ncbi:hypothetical protein ADU59_04695 [Pararhizobium polonicum]|uniref:Uncharacterized protein n=1 Tax=Pararhizobium polonicum TaxID=1612624 RepID=A0A1C7P725_9HYPH|nr:hypothetical protein [Pararhizobium polonicum]OBZ96997.1 hypothetical protein ADU59_04695 [Pararhizobium polonicum]
MITPLQTSAGTVSTTLMQSMIDQAEENRIEDEKKARKETKEEDILKARVSASKSHAALNDKVNAHFFGALKGDDNAVAELISRFLNILGVTRDEGETDADFGTRIADSLTLISMIGKDEANLPVTSSIPGREQNITLARFQVSVDGIDAVLDGSAEQPTEMTKMAARFVTRYGLTQNEDESDIQYSKRIGETMANVRKSMPASIAVLETKAGLRDLGLTAAQMVEAIKNPSGTQMKIIQEVLDDKARADGISTQDAQIAIQRLEDIANPKSIAELKLERTHQPDPTRVENEETRKEREEDIHKLEAAEKLEDVKDVQETIAKVNEAILNTPSAPATGTTAEGQPAAAAVTSGDLLVTLAAGAEMAEVVEKAESTAADAGAARIEAIDTDAGTTEVSQEARDEADAAVLLARSGPGDAAAPVGEDAAASGILAVGIDENGIYEILKRQSEETRALAA